jgi:glycosyltransferase involved in cell wall biosynthesis
MSSTSYPESPQDWRGRFVANMVAALACRRNIKLSLWTTPGELPAEVTSVTTPGDAFWLRRISQQGGIAHLLRTRKALAVSTILSLLIRLGLAYRRKTYDVIHVNWLQNALPLWGTKTPALITVLGADFALLRMTGMKVVLRAVLRQRSAILAPNADWMRPVLEKAFGDIAEIRTIPFGVDNSWFELKRRPPSDKNRHWLVVTRLTQNKIGDLFTWGAGLFNSERQLHLFGPMQEQIQLPSWVQYHGPTHPAELLQHWFPRASGLITLSRHDEGRPQVMLEAMAAGLPIIATDIPAHRDFLQHRQTGCLVASHDEFCEGLKWLEDPVCNQLTGEAARQWAKSAVGTWDDCTSRYVAAYDSLLGSKT